MADASQPSRAGGRRGISQKKAIATIDKVEQKSKVQAERSRMQYIMDMLNTHPELVDKVHAIIQTYVEKGEEEKEAMDPALPRGIRSVGTTSDWVIVKALAHMMPAREDVLQNMTMGLPGLRKLYIFAMGGDVTYVVRPLRMRSSEFLKFCSDRNHDVGHDITIVNPTRDHCDWNFDIGFYQMVGQNNPDTIDSIKRRPSGDLVEPPTHLQFPKQEAGRSWQLLNNHIPDKPTLACPSQYISIDLKSFFKLAQKTPAQDPPESGLGKGKAKRKSVAIALRAATEGKPSPPKTGKRISASPTGSSKASDLACSPMSGSRCVGSCASSDAELLDRSPPPAMSPMGGEGNLAKLDSLEGDLLAVIEGAQQGPPAGNGAVEAPPAPPVV